ncbi:hypothetical protein [Hymenobacter cellulosilyticus]|uniref:Uncharacterized protein n=1 Tax=Hymenobacter cellulosilyticus TaxID=2932248 RepID=A0A8T9QHF6_9BACT|nr:hypothetical protein [Hymenobacter cellulosilyticus]UOQ75270.1 hypothetical protein MUN79_29200 [Hymenobacter cellulosilyticus]
MRDRARFAATAAGCQLPVAAPTEQKTATWKVDELEPNTSGRAEAWKAILDNSATPLRTSDVRSTIDEQGVRRASSTCTTQ